MSKNDMIKINNFIKFLANANEALELVKNGIGKDELLEKSNCVLRT